MLRGMAAPSPDWAARGAVALRLLNDMLARRSNAAADTLGAASVAFPAISTGAYGYPPAAAAAIAIETSLAADRVQGGELTVWFCCFGAEALAICTVSDDIPSGAALTSDERATTFDEMILVALETVIA